MKIKNAVDTVEIKWKFIWLVITFLMNKNSRPVTNSLMQIKTAHNLNLIRYWETLQDVKQP